jgi:hypothetical protein
MAKRPATHPTLATPRLRLRQFRPEDTDAMHECFADPEAMRFWNTPVHTNRIETERAVRRFIDCTPSYYHSPRNSIPLRRTAAREPAGRRRVAGRHALCAPRERAFQRPRLGRGHRWNDSHNIYYGTTNRLTPPGSRPLPSSRPAARLRVAARRRLASRRLVRPTSTCPLRSRL